jgi:Ca-activated chloride channel family protein
MNIVNPKLLFLLLLLLPLIGLVIIIQKRYQKRFGKFADPGFWDFYWKDWSFFFFRLKAVLLIIAAAFIILALVRPQWDRETQDIKRSGLDIAICIDVSKSMDATDISPSRLQRAKDQIAAFIDDQKGDRIALIPFAGIAAVQCPLTDDYEAARMLLSSLTTNSVPVWGTDIGKALSTAGTVFDKNTKTRVVVLISDGEDLNGEAVKAAKDLATKGIIVYVMGVGTPGGAVVKLPPEEGFEGVSQTEITSKLDTATLEKIATLTGGMFFMITPTQDEIQAILKNISTLEKSKLSSRRMSLYKEQYSLFAILALLLLLIETILSARVSKNNKKQTSKTGIATGLMLIFLFFPLFNLSAITFPWTKAMHNAKGNAEYKKKAYPKAEKTFEQNALNYPKDNVLQYNYGNSLYQQKKAKEAADAWQKALGSKDNKLKSRAWQNLGNQQFQAKNYQDALQS